MRKKCYGNTGVALEARRPDLTVTLIESLVEGVGTPQERKKAFMVLAKRMDLPKEAARVIYDRFANKYRVVVDGLRKANTVDILALLDHCIRGVMESLASEDWSKVGARDKAVIGGILIDKRQLLSGEPTAIISVDDRRSIEELSKAFVYEAKRRGLVHDLQPGEYTTVAPKVAIVKPAE